jgi:hypothetical protein
VAHWRIRKKEGSRSKTQKRGRGDSVFGDVISNSGTHGKLGQFVPEFLISRLTIGGKEVKLRKAGRIRNAIMRLAGFSQSS